MVLFANLKCYGYEKDSKIFGDILDDKYLIIYFCPWQLIIHVT